MKNNLFLLLCGIAMLLTSCTPDDEKKCGNEDFERYAVYPGITPNLFNDYLAGQYFSEQLYTTFYTTSGGRSRFIFSIAVSNVCSYEPILVSPTLQLVIANADIKDTLYISEPSGTKLEEGIAPSNGVIYMIDEIYPFTTTSPTTSFNVGNIISFPSQGSWSADSLYFWGQVVDITFSVQYKTAQ